MERDEQLDEEMKEKRFNEHIERQKEQIEDLKDELKNCEAKLMDREKDTDLLHNLYDRGFIDIDGNPIDKR